MMSEQLRHYLQNPLFLWWRGRTASKKHVLVLGTGERAMRIATRMRRDYDRRGFELHGYVLVEGTPNLVANEGASIRQPSTGLLDYCKLHHIDEIVVALDACAPAEGTHVDERLDELVACRMGGVSVVDALAFVEREAGRIDSVLLTPEWFALSRGFIPRLLNAFGKRLFDTLASAVLLLLTSPLMLIGAVRAMRSRSSRQPIFSRERCNGRHGRVFERLRFNLPGGSAAGDLTRRLPELLDVLVGNMSLVGPRPAPMEDAERWAATLPYYRACGSLRPGMVGWAQLNCSSDAARKDAAQNLQYDLYYLKNHTLLLDLTILARAAQMLVSRRTGY